MKTYSVSIAATAIGAIQLKQPAEVMPRWQKLFRRDTAGVAV